MKKHYWIAGALLDLGHLLAANAGKLLFVAERRRHTGLLGLAVETG